MAGERRRRGKMDRRSTELSLVIKNTLEQTIMLELLPRSQIDVYVQVLQADGGTRCACINAAMLALADAGRCLQRRRRRQRPVPALRARRLCRGRPDDLYTCSHGRPLSVSASFNAGSRRALVLLPAAGACRHPPAGHRRQLRRRPPLWARLVRPQLHGGLWWVHRSWHAGGQQLPPPPPPLSRRHLRKAAAQHSSLAGRPAPVIR